MRDCLQQARQGDQEAILRLWRKYKACALKAAARYSPRAYADREDFQQCAYLGFHIAVMRYDEKCPLGRLIDWCVRNECRRLLGIRTSKRNVEAQFSLDALAADGETPYSELIVDENLAPSDDGLLEADLVRDVRAAVEALPERERRLVIAYHLHHEQIGVIAAREGISQQRIHFLLSRALALLRADDILLGIYAADFQWQKNLYQSGLSSYKRMRMSVQECILLKQKQEKLNHQ
ncbi:MAG: sigma-70 family RNA polymerase sigma factor [Clostridia bacterium]|nr:sigma-70 family RNA polymerase sigma factor [Clostridia bacterium]